MAVEKIGINTLGEIPEVTGIILEGRHLSPDEITLETLLRAREKGAITPQHFESLLIRYANQLELDSLTGLLNRRLLKPKYDKLMSEMDAGPGDREMPPLNSVMLIVIDLDKLKEINDTEGHASGDKAIQGMADRVRENFHDTDMIFRIGGDELVILMPIYHTGDVDHEAIFRERRAKILGGFSLSMSVGYHVVKKGDKISLKDALGFADQDMYKSKKDRR